jgi:hypothetical protein
MQMTNRPPVNPSQLTQGWHPGYLIHISEETTPDGWKMKDKSPTMWRWHFVVWENPQTLQSGMAPEQQSGITSAKFSPKGQYVASKAWTWTTQILNRTFATGETVDWTQHFPAPCRIKASRGEGKDYIKIEGVEAWPEGQQYVRASAWTAKPEKGLLPPCTSR